jgi:hypothetical protein
LEGWPSSFLEGGFTGTGSRKAEPPWELPEKTATAILVYTTNHKVQARR